MKKDDIIHSMLIDKCRMEIKDIDGVWREKPHWVINIQLAEHWRNDEYEYENIRRLLNAHE